MTNGIDLHSDKNVMVFDFGGGTLDITIVNLKEQVDRLVKLHPHEVKAKRRINCGGELLTRLFFTRCFCDNSKYGVREIAGEFLFPEDLTPDELWEKLSETPEDGVQFCEEVEKLKCQLSEQEHVCFSFIGDNGVFLDDCLFSRKDLEEAISSELIKINRLIDQCLSDASMNATRIDEVVLAGGSSLIPYVHDLLIQKFGRKKVRTKGSALKAYENELLTSVVRGLAIVGADAAAIDDIVDEDYGIIWQTRDGGSEFDIIIPRNTRVADTVIDPLQGIGPHEGPYGLTKKRPERLHIVVGESAQGKTTPIYDTEFEVNSYSERYTVYMSVNPKTGMLEVSVYDEDAHKKVSTFNTPMKHKGELKA